MSNPKAPHRVGDDNGGVIHFHNNAVNQTEIDTMCSASLTLEMRAKAALACLNCGESTVQDMLDAIFNAVYNCQ